MMHRIRHCFAGLFLCVLFGLTDRSLAEVKLLVSPGYLPGIPFLARVEVRTAAGARDWALWNAEALLSLDQPGITLSTNRIVMRNGLGTALLLINGNADFTLMVTVNGEQDARVITYRGGQTITPVSGALPGASTTWNGIVRLTSDVTVPPGHILTIQSNTIVLIDGIASGTSGIDLLIQGTLRSLGTELHPVTITCSNPDLNWGQIRHDAALPAIYQYTFISKAGRAPGEGHTGTGPAIRPDNSTLTFESCVISDLTAAGSTIGKIMMASGSSLTFRDCVLARARMGPEIGGTGLICTNSYIMDMTGPDDADGIYLHGAGGRPLTLSGCVLARGDDDAVDTLDSNVTIENCIIRDWPNPNEDAKGVSVFHGEVQLKRCLIVDCFAGVSAKSSGPLAVVRIDHCTITAIDKGVSAATKANATSGNINFYLTNSIVRAPDAVHSDFGPEKFASITYCNLSESWTGVGNITADPSFVNTAANDYRLQPGSPCIDAGDPAFSPDADGSRTDIGVYTGESAAGGFFVNITSPLTGAAVAAPTNITITATASGDGVIGLEFYEGATSLGVDLASPFSIEWDALRVGNYTLWAVATRADGLSATSAPVAIFVTSGQGRATNILISAASDWKYLDDGSNQGVAWTGAAFDDSSWKVGKAQLGYGDGDEATVIGFGPNANNKHVTSYFRRVFLLDDPSQVEALRLNLLRDDGALIHLNGLEIHRTTMPLGPVDYRTFATMQAEYSWEATALDHSRLIAGINVLAVEVHQGNASSSDVSFDLELMAVMSAPTNARPLITITAPEHHAVFAVPATFTVTANALDVDGRITNVAFYAGSTKLSDDSASPYQFVWSNVPAGTYAVTAVASDDGGLSATSSVVEINVSSQAGPPRVSRQFPTPGPVTNLMELTVTFNKPVVGVNAEDLLVGAVPAVRVTGSGADYTFIFAAPAPGPKRVTWSASHGITDTFTPASSFDHNAPGAIWDYEVIDTLPPRLLSLTPAARSTVASFTNVLLTFTESVSAVTAGDLLINSLPATDLAGSGAGPYTFSFPEPQPGTVVVAWSESQRIRDQANNLFGGGSWSYLLDTSQAAIVINEIMYHPSSENPLEEYIELYNRGAAPLNLQGWRMSHGVNFAFPDVTVPAGGYLVVTADLVTFKSKYPGVSNVVGNWTGTLSNSREDIDFDDAAGDRVDSVRYADEGDWAMRRRGALDRGHRGWVWFAEHDGLGKSLELRNPAISNNRGQNWASSLEPEGTPGRANSVFTSQIAPFIENAAHFPAVPKSTELVLVSARIQAGAGATPTVTLYFRRDSLPPGPFSTVEMRDDGFNGDASPADDIYTAIVPAQMNNSVVEFYIAAVDATGISRTWPSPTITAADGTDPPGQMANALYQVDDTDYAGPQPLYKFILTEAERLELENIHANINGAANSDAQMNATFISVDGTGAELRYLTGVRNRGHGTRTSRPSNVRVNFRSDEAWKNVLALNINAQFSWLQVLGAALNLKSGGVGAYSQAVQVRVNNANLAFLGGPERTYGSYAANEVVDADWADRHFPDDGEGNTYRALRDLIPADFDYRTQSAFPGLPGPDNKASYTNTWFKSTNISEDDWTDLIGMLQVFGVNGTQAFTPDNLRRVINVEEWLRHLAIMNFLGNGETGLNSGYNDDYFMYRGVQDPRFILMYYDLDQILGFNNSFAANASLFSAATPRPSQDAGSGFSRFLHHPEFEPVFYAILQDLIDTTFSAQRFNALVDQILGDFVPELTRLQLKTWMDVRRAYVRSQLPEVNLSNAPVALVNGMPRSPTPRQVAALNVSGEGITHYRFSLNGSAFGPETPVAIPISLPPLPNGTNTVAVIGKNSSAIYQATANATVVSWVVNLAWPSIRINEVIASRTGNLPDQVELYNEGEAPVNLAGMRLTDNLANPNKFTFQSETIAPGAYLVLDAARLGFSLAAAGEGLYLFHSLAAGGPLLDSVEFGSQIADLSLGRIGDRGSWHLTQPTFGSSNIVQQLADPRKLSINEWLTFGVSPFPDDFVEIYNPEVVPIPIGGFYLTDQPFGAPARSPIPALSFIQAQGYLVFSSHSENLSTKINFGLDSEQGEIALFSSDLSLIDCVIYRSQRIGVSEGRCPDGALAQRFLLTPTPGGPNHCPDIAPPAQTLTLVAFTNIWKFDASGADQGSAWKDINYDDSSWSAGPGVLGFETALLPEPLLTSFPEARGITTFYFRTLFSVDLALAPSSVQLVHLIDDGAAFYLNGEEIGPRYNLAAAADYQTFASGLVSEAGYQVFAIPADKLRPGTNLFAVEVHQVNATSSDLVFGLKIDALLPPDDGGQSGLLLNEVFANNATVAEPDGSRPDWVELFNPSSNTIDLAEMSLSDNLANPRQWIFPPGSVLPPGGFFKVRCSAEAPASDTNTGFSLKANGGAVHLFTHAPNNTRLQSSVSYGLQAADWSIGRVPDGGVDWKLNFPTGGRPNLAASLGNPQLLKLNEWMADSLSEEDWFEIFNLNAEPVDISLLRLSDSLTDRMKFPVAPLSFIGNGDYAFQQFVADENVAEGADHVNFKLSTSGEAAAISTPGSVLIDGVSFGPQVTGTSQGRFPDGSSNLVNFPTTPTPGSSNFLPFDNLVINELLSHSDLPLEDAVELYNSSAQAVDISGWFMSDSPVNLRKYQLPANTLVPAGGYLVLYEYQFNSAAAREPFSFSSARGDEIYLSQASNGTLTGYRAFATFGPAENGVSSGRIPTSQGFHFVPMVRRTFGKDNPGAVSEFRAGTGAPNSAAKIGPIVISEIMYHPPGTNDALEFVELHNVSASSVTLHDPSHPANRWHLRKGIEFEFPSDTIIPPGGYLILVNFDPRTDYASIAAFQTAYGNSAVLAGPYRGKLNNGGDAVELAKPDLPQIFPGPDFGLVPYILVDRVDYAAGYPWPQSADGAGDSLQKTDVSAYGNDPFNWIAGSPTPGAAADYLRIESVGIQSQGVAIRFRAAAGRSYSLLYSDGSPTGPWRKLRDVPGAAASSSVEIVDPNFGASSRFYRMVTPALSGIGLEHFNKTIEQNSANTGPQKNKQRPP